MLQITMSVGSNSSFMDYFLRKYFEEYLCSTSMTLESVYLRMNRFFQLDFPIGSYIRRNLTCAAGNIFSAEKRAFSGYTGQYIHLADFFAGSDKVYEKKTSYFLIKNSVSPNNPKLHKDLRGILLSLIENENIKKLYERDRDLFSSKAE